MRDLIDAFAAACQLVLSGDPALVAIVALSLNVSLAAVLAASIVGLPIGATLAILRFPGGNGAVVVVKALLCCGEAERSR